MQYFQKRVLLTVVVLVSVFFMTGNAFGQCESAFYGTLMPGVEGGCFMLGEDIEVYPGCINPWDYAFQTGWFVGTLYEGSISICMQGYYRLDLCYFEADCGADSYEDDDTCPASREILGVGSEIHSLCCNDDDWYSFYGQAGRTYSISITNEYPESDAVMRIYSGNCATLQAENLDRNPSIDFVPETDGTYKVKIFPKETFNTGYYALYSISYDIPDILASGFGPVPDGMTIAGDPLTVKKIGDNIQCVFSEVTGAEDYNLYRGDLSSLVQTGMYCHDARITPQNCPGSDFAQINDFSAPLVNGDMYYYVATAVSGSCESGAGYKSDGSTRESTGFWPSTSCTDYCP